MPSTLFQNLEPLFIESLLVSRPQKILVVADGSLGFDAGMSFGLTEFIQVLSEDDNSVSTAHRNGMPSATIAGDFRFRAPGITPGHAPTPADLVVDNFDQVWMFGFNDIPLEETERRVIESFMQNGGGVFATGDHERLGSGMGAYIPRVRSMRNWASIHMSSPRRLDTVIDPGSDGRKQFNDQADDIPQRIYPVFFSNGGPESSPSSWAVHPVLRHASGAVDVLPDHPHESECLAPTPGPGNFSAFEEWPAPIDGGGRIAAVIVAVSMSAGRFVTDNPKPPVLPRSFGAISAYDGDPAHVGRIVCDATWHHFVNINLNGMGAGDDPRTRRPRQGLKPGGVPTPEYLKIQAYYRNTVRWLAPRRTRFHSPIQMAIRARFSPDARELQLPHPSRDAWDVLEQIGATMQGFIDGHFGTGTMASLVDDMVGTLGEGSGLAGVIDSRILCRRTTGAESLLPVAAMRRVIFASMVNLLAEKLPQDDRKLEEFLKGDERFALDIVSECLVLAEAAISEEVDRMLKVSRSQFALLGKRPVAQALAQNLKLIAPDAKRSVRRTADKGKVSPTKKKP